MQFNEFIPFSIHFLDIYYMSGAPISQNKTLQTLVMGRGRFQRAILFDVLVEKQSYELNTG